MTKEEAKIKAIKYATEKGWRERDVIFLTKDDETFVFYLYMPPWGDFGSPCGVFVNDNICDIKELTLQHHLLLYKSKLSKYDMTIQQVKEFFQDKEQYSCPVTEKLVKAGYQQVSGGYINRAKDEGMLVDYNTNSPSQYWHLMSYCEGRDGKKTFSKSIDCGELIFWMAEVSGAVDSEELDWLADQIIESGNYSSGCKPIYDRIMWNSEIHRLCFDRIQMIVEKSTAYKRIREMIARCEWTFAKTMPWCPHEYIVRDKCTLSDEEFVYFVNMQREYGVKEHWGKYYFPYLYIDDYKYWTMGAPIDETIIINRAKVDNK